MRKSFNFKHFCQEVVVIFALISSAACLRAPQAQSSDLLAQSEDPQIEIRSELPGGLIDTAAKMRASQLVRFLSTEAYAKLPSETQQQLRTRKFVITVVKANTADGLFIDTSHTGSKDLIIELNQARFQNENAFQILAHEFFHAVQHVINPGEKAWVREGLAQLFEYRVLRYFNGVNVEAALKDLSTPLQAEYSIERINPAQYGHSLLYFYYLWKNCGGDKLFWQIANSGLESAFARDAKEQCSSFEASVINFEIARAHNRRRFDIKTNTGIHHLISTTAQGTAEKSGVSEDEINAMPQYSAVTLSSEVKVRAASDRKIFWLQKEFPYGVSEKMPENPGKSWRILLIRI